MNIKSNKKRGNALITTFFVMILLAIAASSFIGSATQSLRISNRQQYDIQATHLCEAGIQAELHDMWRNFKTSQNFFDIDPQCSGASSDNPRLPLSGALPGIGNYSVAVISFSSPAGDNYSRNVTLRSVGWVDRNRNGKLDDYEPRKIVDVTTTLSLVRSKIFDYTYFVNNYGWMDGFGPNDLVINGDMRANGNFNFLHGSPTVNGSVVASINEKLLPGASGLVNGPPVKWSTQSYASQAAANARWRPAYDQAVDGAVGTQTFRENRDMVFNSDATMSEGRAFGATLADALGTRSWDRQSLGQRVQSGFLDQNPTSELVMPDLSDVTRYTSASSNYTDQKQSFLDGTPNPNYGKGAFVEMWDPKANNGIGAYVTISQGGVVSGSAALVGTNAHPIRIHGPVTFTQDLVIKGNIAGQGTLYAGRNIHIVGSVRYTNAPDFRGASQSAMDAKNERADMLGLAARGSVIMGDTSTFTSSYPLQYMTPPFTHDRLDENGKLIPAFNANQVDETGFKKYQSVLGDKYIHSISEGVNQIDAVMYTNFVGGGNIGTAGRGVDLNGTIISRDEAMVVWSLPMHMNYDNRIRERGISKSPLIDIVLPRSPVLLRSSWHERGFFMGIF